MLLSHAENSSRTGNDNVKRHKILPSGEDKQLGENRNPTSSESSPNRTASTNFIN
jgi:hypothetical protein